MTQEVRSLIAAGRWRDAVPLLERLVAADVPDPALVRQLAELEILDGRAERAMTRLAALGLDRDDEAAFLAARAESALGRFDAARERLVALRARLPQPSAMLEVHLAAALQQLGDREAALAALREAVRLRPDFAAAHENLIALLETLGRDGDARAALRAAVEGAPGAAMLWLHLAYSESATGDEAAARAALARAEALDLDARGWHLAGMLYAEYWSYEDARRSLARSSALDPGQVDTEISLAWIHAELGDTPGALACLERAARRNPGNLRVTMSERLILPQVYASTEDLRRWRERYRSGLERLAAELPGWKRSAAEILDLARNNFLLAYQGEDDHDLQARYSGFIHALAGAARPDLVAPRPIRFDGTRRLRVGFIANTFRQCTAGRYFEHWITGLDRERFERVVYHLSPEVDPLTRRIEAASDRFAMLRGSARELAARIAADDLDVLVYPEVGMAPITYVLAALRLAPVQMAGWGHPVTTGSAEMDYYVTAGPMEPPDADRHYTETLIRLPGIGVTYPMPEESVHVTRAQLGLPEERRIYVCPQSLFKIHPEMDEVFADIMERDPDGIILLFQATARAVSEQMGARLQRTIAARGIPPRGQLKFLGRVLPRHFRGVLGICDVVLDTLHWSGGNTSLDAFATGVPVVTLEGRFMRGRQTAAMLRLMDLPGLVAGDREEYVRIALEVARDRDRNRALRGAIEERRGALFSRREPVAAFAQALLAAGAGRLPRS